MNIDGLSRNPGCVGLVLALSALLMACASPAPTPPPDPTPSDVTTGGSTDSEAGAHACEDMATAMASTAARCGAEYQSSYDLFVGIAAGGDCQNIVMVRDEASLYDTCIPFLSTIPCEQFTDPNLVLPYACKGQLGS